jgi:long-chain-fatty-acid--CoA ligase ACSBG
VAIKTFHSGARVAIVEDQAKLERYKSKLEELPKLTAIVVYSPEYSAAAGQAALSRKDGSQVRVLSWADLRSLGAPATDAVLEERIASLQSEQCATLIYTSGTTGRPKAVMITHDNLVFESRMVLELVPSLGQAGQDRVLSYLPLSHVAGLMVDWMTPINITANCPGYCTTYFARPYDLKVGSLGERLRFVRCCCPRARPPTTIATPDSSPLPLAWFAGPPHALLRRAARV